MNMSYQKKIIKGIMFHYFHDKKFFKQVSLIDIFPTIAYLVNDSFDYTSCDGKNLLPLKSENIFIFANFSKCIDEVC